MYKYEDQLAVLLLKCDMKLNKLNEYFKITLKIKWITSVKYSNVWLYAPNIKNGTFLHLSIGGYKTLYLSSRHAYEHIQNFWYKLSTRSERVYP